MLFDISLWFSMSGCADHNHVIPFILGITSTSAEYITSQLRMYDRIVFIVNLTRNSLIKLRNKMEWTTEKRAHSPRNKCTSDSQRINAFRQLYYRFWWPSSRSASEFIGFDSPQKWCTIFGGENPCEYFGVERVHIIYLAGYKSEMVCALVFWRLISEQWVYCPINISCIQIAHEICTAHK